MLTNEPYCKVLPLFSTLLECTSVNKTECTSVNKTYLHTIFWQLLHFNLIQSANFVKFDLFMNFCQKQHYESSVEAWKTE